MGWDPTNEGKTLSMLLTMWAFVEPVSVRTVFSLICLITLKASSTMLLTGTAMITRSLPEAIAMSVPPSDITPSSSACRITQLLMSGPVIWGVGGRGGGVGGGGGGGGRGV